MRTLPRTIAVFLYGRFFASILQVAVLSVLANLLSKGDMAYVSFVLTIYMTATALGSLGLADAVFYLIGREEGVGARVVRQTTYLLILASGPVIAIVMGLVFFGDPSVDLRPVFPFIAIALALDLPTQPAVNLLVTQSQARRATAVYTVFSTSSLIAVLVPALTGLPIEWTVYLLLVTSAIKVLLYLAIVRRYFPGPVAWKNRAELRQILSYSIPIGLSTLAGTLNKQIDKLVVSFVLARDVMADFTVGSFELPLVTIIPYAVATLQQPLYVRFIHEGRIDELRALWLKSVEKTALVVLPLAVFVIIFAEDLIALVFPAGYAVSVLPFRLFTGILFLRVAAYGPLIRAGGDARPITKLSFLLIVTNVVISVPLTHLLGGAGAALATLIANWFVFILTLPLLRTVLQAPISRVMPWAAMARILGTAAVSGVLAWLVARAPGLSAGPEMAIGGAVFVTLFIVAARTAGLAAKGDVRYVRDFVLLRFLARGP